MTPTKKTTQNLKPNPPNLKAPAPKSPAPTSPASKSPAPKSPTPTSPAPKGSLTPARKGQPGIFAKFRLLAALAVFVLIVRLVVAGFWSGQESDSAPLSPLATPPTSLTAPPAAEAALGSLPANAIAAGAAAFLNSQVAITPAVAQSAASQAPLGIPLPPGEEDLRRPQKTPPSAKPAPTTPAGPPLPPTASGPAAEEQAKKNFDLTRRETQLNAREQALKELEADLTVRLAAADKAKT